MSCSGTMALLTPVGPAVPFDAGCQVTKRVRQASPGKTVVFPSIHPPHLLWTAFGSTDWAGIQSSDQSSGSEDPQNAVRIDKEACADYHAYR